MQGHQAGWTPEEPEEPESQAGHADSNTQALWVQNSSWASVSH